MIFSRFNAEAELNTFHSLGTHNGLCELPVEFPVPMNIAPQAGWQAGDNNFVDTPQRGALLSPDCNLFPHLVTEMGIQAPDIRHNSQFINLIRTLSVYLY